MPLTTAVLALLGLTCLYYALWLQRWVAAQSDILEARPPRPRIKRPERTASAPGGGAVAERRMRALEAPTVVSDPDLTATREQYDSFGEPLPHNPLEDDDLLEDDVALELSTYDTNPEMPVFVLPEEELGVLAGDAPVDVSLDVLSLDDESVVDDFTKDALQASSDVFV